MTNYTYTKIVEKTSKYSRLVMFTNSIPKYWMKRCMEYQCVEERINDPCEEETTIANRVPFTSISAIAIVNNCFLPVYPSK